MTVLSHLLQTLATLKNIIIISRIMVKSSSTYLIYEILDLGYNTVRPYTVLLTGVYQNPLHY